MVIAPEHRIDYIYTASMQRSHRPIISIPAIPVIKLSDLLLRLAR